MESLQKFDKTKRTQFPRDWTIINLGEHVELRSGKSNPTKNLSENNPIPVYGANGITGFFTEYLIETPTIVVGRVGEYAGSIHITNGKSWITDNAIYFSKLPDSLNVNFLGLFLILYDLGRLAEKTGQPKLTQIPIKQIKMPSPPLEEQQKIASILLKVDELKQKTNQIIEQTQKLKKGLMQRLFTKGIGHTKFKKAKFHFRFIEEQIPDSWSIIPIEKISINAFRNGIFKRREEFGSGTPLVNVSDLFSGNDIDIQTLERVRVTNNELKQFAIEEGDIFFCRSSLVIDGIGRTNIVSNLLEPSVFECHVMMIRPDKQKIIPKFLNYYLHSVIAKKFLFSIAMTLTMTTIRQPDLEKLPIVVPTLEEQKKIISILSDLDTKINSLKLQLQILLNLKKGLMQQLLTGKIRVKV